MKKVIFILPLLVLVLGFTAGHIADENLQALLKQFKIEEGTAKTNIFYAVSGPSYYIPNVKVLRDLAIGDRVSAIESIGKNIKEE